MSSTAKEQLNLKNSNDYNSTIVKNKNLYNSYFDVALKDNIKLRIKCTLLCWVTLGLAYPWTMCMKYRSKYNHRVICGKRLKFIGEPKELIKHWFWWWLLCIVTLGIFTFFTKLRMERWAVANVIFDKTET